MEEERNREEDKETLDYQVIERLMQSFSEDVPSKVRRELRYLLTEYVDVFSVFDQDLGRTSL